MRSVGVTIAGCLLVLSGCSYHNVVHNAAGLYAEAEAHRRAGRDSVAHVQYSLVIEKTGQAFRARPDSEWAGEALFLLARSRLRVGDLRAADAALSEARHRTQHPALRAEILVYQAIVQFEAGDRNGALERANEALEGPIKGEALAEAHLLRGRLLLGRRLTDQGWWDLDRASEAYEPLRVEADLDRLRFGVRHDDRSRARWALEGLLAHAEAGPRTDTIVALVGQATARWGASEAARLLAGADSSTWDRTARGRIALERARLLDLGGDTIAAAAQAWSIARGLGQSAAEARLLISSWRLTRSRDLREAFAVRAILLPAGGDPRVAQTLESIELLEHFTTVGLNEALGWFAAAEVARDQLGAVHLARGFFLAYADGAPADPWAPKALLAALEVSSAEGDRSWLRGRLEAHARSPYVLAAFGGPAAGFEELEEELDVRLRELTRR
ncbi:MAG: hypothetical protein O2958_12075 [Gemmatimonadetes bacterium]|nr:hypothetical protein [Gemmatimonadota bacterium]MDA1103035.1 hypothetical protein [Gemmatimonadota bacterium]